MRPPAGFRDEDWGPLAPRYREERPRALLAMDGGGIRGLVTLGVLVRIEATIRERLGLPAEFRLCDYFDYIGGTSTGAIIAVGLARGMSAEEVLGFYERFGRAVFRPRIQRWTAKFKEKVLEDSLRDDFIRGHEGSFADLRPENLHCLLLAVTRNATTDSVWPISSNPAAVYNDTHRPDCNLRIPLWEIVRASSAAPTFFTPHVLRLDARNPRSGRVFVDGATTAYNNPAFLLYRMATSAPYRLGWKEGERNLLLVSVGTGASPAPVQSAEKPNLGLLRNAGATLSALIHQSMIDQDTVCRTVGRCVHGDRLDSELGDLVPRGADGAPLPIEQDLGRAFLYARYNVELTRQELDGLALSHLQPRDVSSLDAVASIEALEELGKKLGERVQPAHFGPFLEGRRADVLANMSLRLAPRR